MILRGITLATLLALVACGGDDNRRRRTQNGGDDGEARSRALAGSDQPADDQGRCDADAADREVSEYDTSGDEYPDVRKVFLTIGAGRLARLILICREADLNGDGIKDVVRYYSDEGRPLREESDRDFDGVMDEVTYFENGRIIRQELDSNGNGQVDTKVFFASGRPERAERDMAGRSTPQRWQPDRWEYFEEGRMVRMGTDLDGDGSVDRWDRDEEFRRARETREREEAERAEAEAAAAAETAANGGEPPSDDS